MCSLKKWGISIRNELREFLPVISCDCKEHGCRQGMPVVAQLWVLICVFFSPLFVTVCLHESGAVIFTHTEGNLRAEVQNRLQSIT